MKNIKMTNYFYNIEIFETILLWTNMKIKAR